MQHVRYGRKSYYLVFRTRNNDFVAIFEFHKRLADLLQASNPLALHFIGKKLTNFTCGRIFKIITDYEGGICLNREVKSGISS